MSKLLLNTFLVFSVVWFALLDRCLIVTAAMPITGEIVVLLLVQATGFGFLILVANGALPEIVEIATHVRSTRIRIFVFVVPLILLLISPAMISDSMYRVRYGNINKFVVHAHVGHDLACCWNPF
jgi:hypothetical protein